MEVAKQHAEISGKWAIVEIFGKKLVKSWPSVMVRSLLPAEISCKLIFSGIRKKLARQVGYVDGERLYCTACRDIRWVGDQCIRKELLRELAKWKGRVFMEYRDIK
jgi:hypothetical protein